MTCYSGQLAQNIVHESVQCVRGGGVQLNLRYSIIYDDSLQDVDQRYIL
jgi:hypothetical protein